MAFHKCRNEGCEVQIEVRNTAEGWRPFEESGSKHNCQFSDYAKKQRGIQQGETIHGRYDDEEKNDHGNELLQQMENVRKSTPDLFNALAKEDPTLIRGYVDHTQGQKLKLKTITDPTPEGMDLKYNRLAAEQNIRWSQSHVTGSQYTMFVWYEEVAK